MNTRSLTASSDSGLSASSYGGGKRLPASPISTRRGPSSPRCSQTLELPGPPLNANVTGRFSSPPSTTYDVRDISALALNPVNVPSS